jgi:hypothetical protein
MYVVLLDKAISIDFTGTPIVCDVIQQDDVEYVDWDTAEPIDWMDLTPDQYQLFKETVDFLHATTTREVFVK